MDSEAGLALFHNNRGEFSRRDIPADETKIHCFTPHTRKHLVFKGEPAPKVAKIVKSANKVITMFFWDALSMIYIEYLEKNKRYCPVK